jgi:hypothetical protein
VAATQEIGWSSPTEARYETFGETLLDFAGSISSGDVLATFK